MKKLMYIVAVPQSMESFVLPRLPWLEEMYDVVGVSSGGPEAEVVRSAGMRLIEVPIARRISPWQDLKSLWKLWRVIRKERPDMVHSMTPKAGLLGMTAAFFAGVPVRMHTFTGLIFPWRTGLMQFILKTTDRITCLFATIINPEGEGVKKQLEEGHITRKPLHIIADGNINGVDTKRFAPDASARQRSRQALGFTDEHCVFVFLGRLVSAKGVPELTEAFSRLVATYPNARLILIGREEPDLDPLPEETNRLLSSHDTILCTGPRSDIENYLAAADIFTLPSHREGFCNSLLEAGAMALPSITCDICGCRDSVDAKTGILIPPHDSERLRVAMETLLLDPEQRHTLGQAARKRMLEHYDRTIVHQALKAFYEKCL